MKSLYGIPVTAISILLLGCSTGGGLNLESYKKIQDGMSYAQVVGIIGKDGVESVSGGGMKIYIWQSSDGILTCGFEKDKLINKQQVGLN